MHTAKEVETMEVWSVKKEIKTSLELKLLPSLVLSHPKSP